MEMMMSDTDDDGDDDDYEVGYRKPPKATQFRRGQSGNPKGRPKGAQNFTTVVRRTARLGVSLLENGRRRRVSTQEAVLLRLREKALAGDARALDTYLELMARHNDDDPLATSATVLAAEDQAILDNYLARSVPAKSASTSTSSANPLQTPRTRADARKAGERKPTRKKDAG
jgi:hypothetical protein